MTWKQSEIEYLKEHISDTTIENIASALGRSERSVRLYCYRNRIAFKEQVKRPIMVSILQIKFGDAKWFVPTRGFYEQVRISQKRFSLLRNGYAQPTEEEIKAVCKAFNMSHREYAELLAARQLDLFE